MASIPFSIQDLCYGLSYLPVLGLCIHQRVLRGQSEDWIWKCLWAMVAVWTAWFAAHDSQLCFFFFCQAQIFSPPVFYRLGIKVPWPNSADRKFSVSFNYKHNLINYLYCEWMNYNRECVGRESDRVLERDLLIIHVNYSYINIQLFIREWQRE